MATPAEKLEAMLTDFESANAAGGKNLRDLLKTTPELQARIVKSIELGNLDTIKPLDPALRSRGVMGGFNPVDKSIALPMDMLNSADTNPRNANTLRLVFGHEIEHSVNKQAIADGNKAFEDKVRKIAEGPSPHDYTTLVKDRDTESRKREANDQIAGFNVLAAHVRRENPKASKEQLYDKLFHSSNQMEQYFDVGGTPGKEKYTPKAGLTIDKNGKIAATKANIDAIGEHFYEANGYPKVYGPRSLALINKIENETLAAARVGNPSHPAPEIKVNLKELGLTGLRLPPSFTDTSPSLARPTPAVPAPALPTPAESPAPVTPTAASASAAASRDFRDVGHPDNGYFQLLRDKLPASVPDNAVAHAMLLAKQGGLTDPSKVNSNEIGLVGGKIWVGGHTPGFHISADPAQSPPMEQVSQGLSKLQAHTTQAQEAQNLRGPNDPQPQAIAR